jgi:glyoxylase-like metal-dependent hydrolase (beta-lactamase superfamily II)
MLDSGASPAHADLFLSELRAITPRCPDWVLLTHWHWDHTFGLAHLGIPAIGQKNITANLKRLQGLAWDDAALAARVASGAEITFCAEHIRKEYGAARDIHVALPTITFDETLSLDLGGVTCELRHLPTVHTDDSLAVWVPEEGVLFLGDALGPAIYAPTPYYAADAMMQLRAFIENTSAQRLVESHSAPVDAAGFQVDNEILFLVAALIREGCTDADALLREVIRRSVYPVPQDAAEVIPLFLNAPLPSV